MAGQGRGSQPRFCWLAPSLNQVVPMNWPAGYRSSVQVQGRWCLRFGTPESELALILLLVSGQLPDSNSTAVIQASFELLKCSGLAAELTVIFGRIFSNSLIAFYYYILEQCCSAHEQIVLKNRFPFGRQAARP